jgi:hypothetical protein
LGSLVKQNKKSVDAVELTKKKTQLATKHLQTTTWHHFSRRNKPHITFVLDVILIVSVIQLHTGKYRPGEASIKVEYKICKSKHDIGETKQYSTCQGKLNLPPPNYRTWTI